MRGGGRGGSRGGGGGRGRGGGGPRHGQSQGHEDRQQHTSRDANEKSQKQYRNNKQPFGRSKWDKENRQVRDAEENEGPGQAVDFGEEAIQEMFNLFVNKDKPEKKSAQVLHPYD